MKIKQVSERFGVSADTLRFYEKIGLLGPITKKNGIRHYSELDCSQVYFILCMKRAGMELETIHHYFALYLQGDKTLEQRYALLQDHKLQAAAQITHLQDTIDYIDLKMMNYRTQITAYEQTLEREHSAQTTHPFDSTHVVLI